MKTASRWSLRHAAVLGVAALLVAAIAAPAPAVTIGSWSGASRTWNSSANFSNVRTLMTNYGHVVEADEAMTAALLADDQMWVIGEAASVPSAPELAALSAWVHGGGTLLVLADSAGVGGVNGSAILSGIGSAMAFGGTPAAAPLAGGIFASEGPPYDIVGQNLVTSIATAITGGTVLAGTYIQYEALGSGYVFAFGDRSDHNALLTDVNGTTVNSQLFLNLAGGPGIIPEPITALGLMAGLGSLMGYLRRRPR